MSLLEFLSLFSNGMWVDVRNGSYLHTRYGKGPKANMVSGQRRHLTHVEFLSRSVETEPRKPRRKNGQKRFLLGTGRWVLGGQTLAKAASVPSPRSLTCLSAHTSYHLYVVDLVRGDAVGRTGRKVGGLSTLLIMSALGGRYG